jgi:hypothetical protein
MPASRGQAVLLRSAVRNLLSGSSAGESCIVRVERRDQWFELTGVVDSQRTRVALLALVPPHDGCRYVIDKLRVSSMLPAGEYLS